VSSGGSLFDQRILEADPVRRRIVLGLLEAALQAVDPALVVQRTVRRDGQELLVADRRFDLSSFDRIVVVGLGKAAPAMARGLAIRLGDQTLTGAVVSNVRSVLEDIDVLVGSHPVPGPASVSAARALLETAASAGPGDLLVVLISGGGSALAEFPADDITVEDLAGVTGELLRSGATIQELNTVRKHLSVFKGGRLAQAAADAGAIITLVLSDVVGNPLDVIASGPTVPDPTTYDDALQVLERHELVEKAPFAVIDHLRRGAAGTIAETPDAGEVFGRQHLIIVGDAGLAGHAVVTAAAHRGLSARLVTSTLAGEAREVATRVVEESRDSEDVVLVYAGETTVTVAGDGSGGRNQELALAAGIALEGDADGVVASFATDGVDGPTTAAGGIGDGWTVERAETAGRDPRDALARNDSHTIMAETGDLLVTGPTGTNVGDVVIVLRSSH
jgi:glycerate 2-kinase